jgi:hypothetical protein
MTIDRLIKKLRKIKEAKGNINFDVIVTEGDEITLGFLTKGEEDGTTKTDK